MSQIRTYVWIAVVLAIVVVIVISQSGSSGPMSGDTAPDFVLRSVDSLSDLKLSNLQGKPVLLVFWADWCGPCNEELPRLKQLHNEYSDRLHIVSVATPDSSLEGLKTITKQQGIDWYSLYDQEGTVSKAYRVSGVPELFLLDKDGRIRMQWGGTVSVSDLREEIDKYIK
ncbi:MAG: TlpA disulfide reductase family protein [bacterium]